MRQNVSRIAADKITLTLDLGRKLRIGHPHLLAVVVHRHHRGQSGRLAEVEVTNYGKVIRNKPD